MICALHCQDMGVQIPEKKQSPDGGVSQHRGI